MGWLERYHASPHQQSINTALMLAGILSISMPLVVEGVQFILRLRRRKDQDTTSFQTSTNEVYRVVLTGGPCSGKTSSLAHVRATCKQAGFEALVVPEVPTILMEGGATYPGLEAGHRLIAFEAALIRLQLQIEESFVTIARSLGKPTVVLMDRGSVDICAYLMPKDWLATLSALGGLTTSDLISRYHQVIHLVTAADGAESFYQLSNNTARTESPKDARVIDRRIQAAWSQHPHLVVLCNDTDFAGKLDKATNAVLTGAREFFRAGAGSGTPAVGDVGKGKGEGGQDARGR